MRDITLGRLSSFKTQITHGAAEYSDYLLRRIARRAGRLKRFERAADNYQCLKLLWDECYDKEWKNRSLPR